MKQQYWNMWVGAIVCSITFGFWQQSVLAGVFIFGLCVVYTNK